MKDVETHSSDLSQGQTTPVEPGMTPCAPPFREKNAAYWEEDNKRRIELILQKNRTGLSAKELEEFTRLQQEFIAYTEARQPSPSINPQPLDELEARYL